MEIMSTVKYSEEFQGQVACDAVKKGRTIA